MELLAAEIMATKNPGEHYWELITEFGAPCSIDAPPTTEHKARPKTPWPEAVEGIEFAGEPILAKLSRVPGNARIDGLKAIARSRGFAAQPSGTEAVYKIYADSLRTRRTSTQSFARRRKVVNAALSASGASVIESGQAG